MEFLQSQVLVKVSINMFTTLNATRIITNFHLTQIIRVIIYGKSILKDKAKTRGHPKGRGQHLGANSVTEGLIAAAAVVIHLTRFYYCIMLIIQ